MTRLLLGLAICAAIFVSTWLGGTAWASKPGGIEPTRSDLRQGIQLERGKVDRYRRNRCLPARAWGATENLWRRQLAAKLRYAQKTKRATLDMNWTACWQWYRSSGFDCIREHEGSWNDPNAPYYGGVQADLNFQKAYGGNWLRRYGTANYWRPRYQVNMAHRGWLARGFAPWPTTREICGL